MHEFLPSVPPDKKAVKQLMKDSSNLLTKLQKPPLHTKRAKPSPQPLEAERPVAHSVPSITEGGKTVVLEEATEFEVGDSIERYSA